MYHLLCGVGRIKAIQLDYSEAHRHLLQAMRKAPQHTAVGFKQTVIFLRFCSKQYNCLSVYCFMNNCNIDIFIMVPFAVTDICGITA